MHIAIVDLGVGNLRSVYQALITVAPDAHIEITYDPVVVERADRVVLPGQGAIETWFESLRQHNLETAIRQAATQKPLLGICVGMQAMFDHSEEDGGIDGLGLFAGRVRHFSRFHTPEIGFKIPQMGWNQVKQTQDHPMWQGIADQRHFYFLHSYCVNVPDQSAEYVQGLANYGHEYVAAVGAGNVFAVQFHPEKSHDDGLQLLKNFTRWNPQLKG